MISSASICLGTIPSVCCKGKFVINILNKSYLTAVDLSKRYKCLLLSALFRVRKILWIIRVTVRFFIFLRHTIYSTFNYDRMRINRRQSVFNF